MVKEQTLPEDTVLIAGGGPVGMFLAVTLAYFGIKSLVLERNNTTTKYVGKGSTRKQDGLMS